MSGISFLVPKTGTGLSCTIYKIPVNFSLLLDMKPGTIIAYNPNKWYRKFGRLGKNGEKVIPRKVLHFFPENFHRDEPFPLTGILHGISEFHTNGKHSCVQLFAVL